MSTGAAILIAGITLIVLLGGLYIHSMLLAVGIVGIIALGKSALLSGLLSYTTFTTVATYSMTTIPLYVLCAQLILEAGVVEDLFNILYNISKGRKGVLGTFCCILGAFLGAVCGSGTATSAALGQAAYPQLVKRGYSSDLAAATSASCRISGRYYSSQCNHYCLRHHHRDSHWPDVCGLPDPRHPDHAGVHRLQPVLPQQRG